VHYRGGAARIGGFERIVVSGTGAADVERIEKALGEWRQGDATLDAGTFFVHLADKRAPLSGEAQDAIARGEVGADEDVFEILSPVEGLVVVSQSCDIVRECSKSECVEVSALIRVKDDATFEAVRKKRRLRYAYVPGLAARRLVADLEKTMTVEKAVVASWSRIEGCRTDRERATFAEALARKRGRFAFPNEFNNGLSRFKDRLKRAEGKKSPAGDLLAALDEIRVQANPDWGAAKVLVFFWFLAEQEKIADLDAARRIVQNWISTISWTDRFVLADPAFAVLEPQDMTVEQYQGSHALDYDDISP
jgi:hypothetical protein